MNKTILVAVFILSIYSGAAVVGGPEPGDGEMAITSTGSSASASTSVGPNGTEWKAQVSMINTSQNITDDRLENIVYSEDNHSVSFNGHISVPTPCHTIEHEVSETEEGYVMNVMTQDQTQGAGTNQTRSCIQVMTMIEYDAEFSTGNDFKLDVRHNNQSVETLELKSEDEEEKSLMEILRQFISSFF